MFLNLRQICEPLYKRLRKNPPVWIENHTKIVQRIKQIVKDIPFLGIPHLHAFIIVEIDASEVGYGGILKKSRIFYYKK